MFYLSSLWGQNIYYKLMINVYLFIENSSGPGLAGACSDQGMATATTSVTVNERLLTWSSPDLSDSKSFNK